MIKPSTVTSCADKQRQKTKARKSGKDFFMKREMDSFT